MLKNWSPRDVVACLLIVTCSILLVFGIDSFVALLLIAVVSAYFGHEHGLHKDKPKK